MTANTLLSITNPQNIFTNKHTVDRSFLNLNNNLTYYL